MQYKIIFFKKGFMLFISVVYFCNKNVTMNHMRVFYRFIDYVCSWYTAP